MDDSAIHWSVPDSLKDCISNYKYSLFDLNTAGQGADMLDMHKQSNAIYSNSQDNHIPLSSLPDNYCEKTILISPTVSASSVPLYDNGLQAHICAHGYCKFDVYMHMQDECLVLNYLI